MERKISMRFFSVLLNSIPQITPKQLDLGFVDQTVSKLSACIRATFFLSHGIRRDTILYILVKDGNYMIKLVGDELKYLGPDARSIAMLLMKSQIELKELDKKKSTLSKRGVYVCENSANSIETLRNINASQVIFPTIKGKSIEGIMLGDSINSVVPLEYPFPDFVKNQLINQGYKEVFFRDIYTIDNFIVMMHNHLDALRGNDNNGDN
jgi:tRNA pseudouridine-54 N-methylase